MRGLRAVVLLLLFPFASIAVAQDPSLVPGLLEEYAAATNDTVRGNTLAQVGYHLIRSNPDSARLVCGQALALARRSGSAKVLRAALTSMGWLAVEQGQLDSGEVQLAKAMELARQAGDEVDMASTGLNLGWVAEKRGDNAGALKHFLHALGHAENARDSARAATINYAIGISYRKAGNFPEALQYLGRSMRVERSLGRRNKVGNCLSAMANIRRDQGDTARAMRDYGRAAAEYAAVEDHIGLGLVQENIGDLLLPGAPRQALGHYRTALASYARVDARLDRAYVLRNLGEAHVRLGDLARARQELAEGRALAVQAAALELVMDYERSLAALATAEGNAPAAALHFNRFIALKDSLQGEAREHEIARLHTAFETERKEKDNALLREQNRSQQQRLHLRETQLYGSLVLAVLALAAIVLLWRSIRQKRRHGAVLEKLNAELARSHGEISEINGLLEMKLLRSQMNPHFIYNCLNSAARMIQEGRRAEALAYLQGFARLLRKVLEHSVQDQVPLEQEVEFLELYLSIEAKRLPGLRYSVKVQEALWEDDPELPALLVQPFVENALWHGLAAKEGSREVRVCFSRNGQGLACEITDNGIGRQQAGRAKVAGHHSLGIQLTGERLRLLARRMGQAGSIRTFDLKDPEGRPQGTRVTLLL